MPLSYSTVEQRILDASVTLQAQNPPLIAQTAREFNVPYQRLLARYHGRQSKQTRPGAGRKLDPAQELAVCHYLDHLDRMGTSARYSMLAQCANSILKRSHNDPATPAPTVSRMWPNRFLKAHPEFKMRKQQPLDIARKNAHDPEAIYAWFRGYKKLCEEYGIDVGDRYNFDETEFRIGVANLSGLSHEILAASPTLQAITTVSSLLL